TGIAQNPADPSTRYGAVPFQTYLGEQENVNAGSGNLNIQLPLLKLPGRNGHDFEFSLTYNSQIWWMLSGTTPNNINYYSWQHNVPWGWNLPTLLYDINVQIDAHHTCNAHYRARMWDGRVVPYPTVQNGCMYIADNGAQSPAPDFNILIGNDGASCDHSVLIVPASAPPYPRILLKNGETLWFEGSNGANLVLSRDVDSNGNTITYSYPGDGTAIITDTVQRTITIGPGATSYDPMVPAYISYKDSDGTLRTINFATQPFNVAPTFGFAQASDPSPTTMNLLSSITLANGGTFRMEYSDGYAELTRIVYPTGGQ